MSKNIAIRTCIVSREQLPKSDLMRFVLVNGIVELDKYGNINGRGANMCKSLEIYDKGVESDAFTRAFKQKIGEENLKDLRVTVVKYLNREALKDKDGIVKVRVKGNKISLG